MPVAPPKRSPAPDPEPEPPQPSEPTRRLLASLPLEMQEGFVPLLQGPAHRVADPKRMVGDVGRTMQNQQEMRQVDVVRKVDPPAIKSEAPAPIEGTTVTSGREFFGQGQDPELGKATEALLAEGWLDDPADAPAHLQPNDARATVGSAEYGVQPRENLRLMPLQKLSGQYGLSPNAVKNALVLQYAKRIQKREGLPGVHEMTPEQYRGMMERAEEEATRFVSGVVGASEAEGNMLVPMQSTADRALAIRRGEDLPLPAKALMAGPLLGMKLREMVTGARIEDQATSALMAPLWALARPGQVAGAQSLDDLLAGGKPVEREGKFSWVTRLGPLSAVMSWMADPELSYELGGENGFGGQKHIEKVVSGYDIMNELPRLGEAYASLTPWEDSKPAKILAGLIPLGAAILMEPDALSIGTGLIGAPASKLAKEAKLGKFALRALEPVLKEWADILAKTGDIDEVARAAGRPGSAGWLLFQAMKGDLLSQAWEAGAKVDRLGPDDLSGFDQGVLRAFGEVSQAAQDVRGAQNVHTAAQVAAQTDIANKLRPLVTKASDARRDLVVAESNLVRMAVLAPGAPAKATDILSEMSKFKKVRTQLAADLMVAAQKGDFVEARRLTAAIRSQKSATILNAGALLKSKVASDYLDARKLAMDQINILGRARATTRAAPKLMNALDRAIDSLHKATDLRAAAVRQQKAFDEIPKQLAKVIEHYQRGVKFSLDSIARGTNEATDLGRSVLDDVAVQSGRRWSLDGNKYYSELVSRYGADAVNQALQTPGTRWVAPFLSGRQRLRPNSMAELRRFEEAAHHASEAARLRPGVEVRGVLRTIGESPLARGWGSEAWAAWTYQMAARMGRGADRVSASIVGKAPRQVQELARRAFGRYHSSELELDRAAAEGGIAAMREFLTSATSKFGTVSNRDTMTIADKAVSFLEALARGSDEAWSGDVVIDALARAPLPSWFEGSRAAGNTKGALRTALQSGKLTGASLVQWLEHVPSGIFGKQLGTADASQVQFRFISRAILHAANQHDAMFDVLRLTGPNISADAARSLNFMVSRNIKDLTDYERISMAAAAEAADRFGLPFISKTAGKLRHMFAANRESSRLIHAATIEGKEHWIPYTLWRALNEVPFKLSKELAEFDDAPNVAISALDKLSRLWRISTVNGWIFPRAAHFTNTLFGDWSQMVQSLGWRQGTRLALQSAPSYLPFVGRKLQDKLLASNSSIVHSLFNPTLGKVLKAGDDYIVDTAEGPVVARRFLQEAFEDGCWDSISTRDLQEATARHGASWWKRVAGGAAPPWIERSAKMMEEVQMRNRLSLYTELRNSGLGREQARKRLNEALYDWSTGVPEWEMQSISRVAAFWTYRRSMLKQLGGSLTEGFTTPAAEYWPKALAGQTKIARMRQMAQLASAIPEAIYWEDPDELIDDAEQMHRYALHSSPWWLKAQAIIANRQIDPERELWYSEVAGRKVTYESLMLPALTTLDQLYLLNLFIQTTMATTVLAAEKAGLEPSMTTIDAREIWERNVDGFADTMMPGFDDAAGGILRGVFGRGDYKDPRGQLVPQAQAVILHRSGFGSFMAAHPDADGSWRIDPGAYGLFTSLTMSFPPAADVARNWTIFADNPGYQQSLSTGLSEALQRWVGFKPAGFDPARSRDYEVDDQARKMKEEASALRKQLEPKGRR